MYPALIPGLPTVGGPELIILLVIILLLFGAKRIPELARGLGTGVREFKKSTSGETDEVREEDKKDGELTQGAAPAAGEDTHNVRMQEEAARAERDGERADRADERVGDRTEQKR